MADDGATEKGEQDHPPRDLETTVTGLPVDLETAATVAPDDLETAETVAPIDLGTAETGAAAEPGSTPRPAAYDLVSAETGASSDGSPQASDPTSAELPVLGDRFDVIRRIGAGAMGAVFEVRHRDLDKHMAVKLMTSGLMSESQLRRFQREARAASDIAHPNILRVTDLDRTPRGAPFIVMELLRGQPLDEVVATQGPMPVERVVELLRGVADALDEAHAQGIVHRDLKPANLFLTEAGVVKILDFGICRYEGVGQNLTRASAQIGTPLYMAPEQLLGERATSRTDGFALGAIAAELLAGRPILEGLTLADRLEHATAGITADDHGPPIRAATLAALERAMAPLPSDRFESATALVAALERSAGPVQPAAEVADKPPAPVAPASPPPRPQTRRGWIVGALVLVLAAGSLAVLRPWEADDPAADPAPAAAPEWPAEARLAVLPFTHDATRSLDATLWPLFDRLVVNALDRDQRVYGRLDRIDPLAVAAQIEARELTPPFGDDAAAELAGALDANLALRGRLERSGGMLRVQATLSTPTSTSVAPVAAEASDMTALSRLVADQVRQTLWPSATAVPADRPPALLVGTTASVQAMTELLDMSREGEHDAIGVAALAQDPKALGVAWVRFLYRPASMSRRRELAARATALGDPELVQLFGSLAAGDEGAPCEGTDVDALGARHPDLLGPLVAAACAYAKNDWVEALRHANRAFDRVALRPLAWPLIRHVLSLSKTCDEQLPTLLRLQQLTPDRVTGWSLLANWYAKCQRMDDARQMLKVTRSLLGKDRGTRFMAGYQGALVELAGMDVEAAREWVELLETHRDPERPKRQYYFITSLASYMQGRFGEGLERTREGLETFRERPGYDYTMLAASYFYMLLGLERLDEAERFVGEVEEHFKGTEDVGDRYQVAMLRLAIDWARGRTTATVAAQRLAQLAGEIIEELGALGRDERDTQECLLLSHLGSDAQCEAVLMRSSASNKLLGGCRYRFGKALLARGESAPAAAELQRAVIEIIWGRFLYADFIAPAWLASAKAAVAANDPLAAQSVLQKLVRSYGRAEVTLEEVVEARRLLTTLPR